MPESKKHSKPSQTQTPQSQENPEPEQSPNRRPGRDSFLIECPFCHQDGYTVVTVQENPHAQAELTFQLKFCIFVFYMITCFVIMAVLYQLFPSLLVLWVASPLVLTGVGLSILGEMSLCSGSAKSLVKVDSSQYHDYIHSCPNCKKELGTRDGVESLWKDLAGKRFLGGNSSSNRNEDWGTLV